VVIEDFPLMFGRHAVRARLLSSTARHREKVSGVRSDSYRVGLQALNSAIAYLCGAWPMALAIVDRFFLSHPRTAGQSYLQHQRFAWKVALTLLGAASAAFIHGLLPNIFCTRASDTIKRLHAQLEGRHPKPLDPGF
jgi:Family of unknown function (DUF6356)